MCCRDARRGETRTEGEEESARRGTSRWLRLDISKGRRRFLPKGLNVRRHQRLRKSAILCTRTSPLPASAPPSLFFFVLFLFRGSATLRDGAGLLCAAGNQRDARRPRLMNTHYPRARFTLFISAPTAYDSATRVDSNNPWPAVLHPLERAAASVSNPNSVADSDPGVNLSLSTAEPTIRKTPPLLGSTTVSFKPEITSMFSNPPQVTT